MKMTLLSLAPLPVAATRSLLSLSPGLADTEIVAGHDLSDEEFAKAPGKADVVLGDRTFKHRIGRDLLAKAGPLRLKLIQQPSIGMSTSTSKPAPSGGSEWPTRPTPIPSA